MRSSETAGTAPIVGTAATTAVIMACGVVTGLIAARSLGPDGRGQLAALMVWATTFVYAGDLSIPSAVAYLSAVDRDSRARLWTTAQLVAVMLGLLIALAAWWIIPWTFVGDNLPLIPFARWFVPLYAIPLLAGSCALGWLQGRGDMTGFNVGRATVPLVNATGMVILLALGDTSVLHFAAVLVIGNMTSWVVSAAYGARSLPAAAPPSGALARSMLRYGMRLQVGGWSNLANMRLDQLLLSIFASAASLGVYVVAVNYAALLYGVTSTAAMVMLPDIVAAHSAGTGGACLQRWYRRLLWITAAAAVVLAASSIVIIPVVIGPAFSSAVPLALLLVPAVLILGMNHILQTACRGIGHPEIESRSEMIGLAVTAVALAMLLPRYGVYGAAVASLLSYAATHVYLLKAVAIRLGVSRRSLFLLTHEDVGALRQIVLAVARRGGRRNR